VATNFPPRTPFSSVARMDTSDGEAYAQVTFTFDPGEYPELHTVTASDVAAAIRDLFVARGYTFEQFTAPVTSSAELDWPQGD
jgi:hypothetical protein